MICCRGFHCSWNACFKRGSNELRWVIDLSETSSPLSRANIVVQCESWWNLAKQFASRSPPLHLLSSSVQRSLMKALVLGGFAQMDSDTKQQYWAEVTSPRRGPDPRRGDGRWR